VPDNYSVFLDTSGVLNHGFTLRSLDA